MYLKKPHGHNQLLSHTHHNSIKYNTIFPSLFLLRIGRTLYNMYAQRLYAVMQDKIKSLRIWCHQSKKYKNDKTILSANPKCSCFI